jgi:acetate kinase
MGTRSGDVDPALPGLLMRRAGMTVEAAEKLLNRHSGLLGVSGRSSDMRDLLAAEAAGDERAGLAIALFCHRLRKTIGAYLAVLGGADAILFGGGIGLYAAPIRARACAGLEWAGIAVDAERNAALSGDGTISPASAPVEVFVAAVDEESDIARDALLAIASAAARP